MTDGAPAWSRSVPAARLRIRNHRATMARRTVVLDDDPTGSQTVHDIPVLTVVDPEMMAASLHQPGSACFILTNTRSMDPATTFQLNEQIGRHVGELEKRFGSAIDIISRGDSTLRGHMIVEVDALSKARREEKLPPYDAVLFAPGFLEAGRYTEGDIHWAVVGGVRWPVGETEFARDATFGFGSSNLRDFVIEHSDGRIGADDVTSIQVDDVESGPDRVAEVLDAVRGGGYVVVNGTSYADYESVVEGAQILEAAGRRFLYRTGPSFVRAQLGMEPRLPLGSRDIWKGAMPIRHGLVVIGSHVAQTVRQLAVLRSRVGLVDVEVSVPALLASRSREQAIDSAASRIVSSLVDHEVVLSTSRDLVSGTDSDSSLAIARSVSAAMVEIVRRVAPHRPAWVLSKGGITSHDVALHGLDIRRATVIGQLFPGLVSVLIADDAPRHVIGVPYIVFAGNVGDDDALLKAVDVMRVSGPLSVDP
jgi:uncharacterized protein YgbK (DUF1537 family)